MSSAATAPQPSLTYAGIGARFLAMIVDGLIVGCVGFVLVMVLGRTFGNLAYIVLAFGYGTMLESSEKQATFGKQMMSIRVTDLNGGRSQRFSPPFSSSATSWPFLARRSRGFMTSSPVPSS